MRKLILLSLFIVCTCFGNKSYAQALSSYGFSTPPGTYTAIAGTIAPFEGGTASDLDDDYSNSLPIGFTFTYCSVAYTSLSVSWNGFVTLGETFGTEGYYINDLSNTVTTFGVTPNAPRPILAPLWTDLKYAATTQISYITSGTAPNRTFTVQWGNSGFYSSSTPREGVQLILHETSNIIDFVYQKISTGTYSSGCAIGITGGSGASVTGAIPYWSLSDASAAPIPSMTIETRNISTQPATNQVYRWTPPCNSGTITGTASVCVGSTTNLTDAVTAGTWTSGNTGVATVGSTTGVVTGVSGGTSTISYAVPAGCYTVTVVTVNPTPATINGSLSVCVGSTTTLTDASAGTWSSSNTSVATVVSGTGVVTGVSSGTSNITIMSPAGCYTVAVVTVNPVPTAVLGSLTVCVGGTTTLSDATAGGTWTGSGGAATITTGGVVSGTSAGTTTVTYTLPTGCNITAIVTVNPTPTGILGATSVCVGSTITLSDLVGGGTWSSSAIGVATIDPTGLVTGMGTGTSMITYSLGTGCYTTLIITVNLTPAAISGTASVCVGSVTSLSDGTGGGTWSSVSPGIGSVDGSGNVTGVSAGTTTISYTLGSCAASVVVTVNTQPGPILGTLALCATFTTTLSDSPTGGVWSSGSLGVATISGVGVVSGLSSGTSVISYTLGGCASSAIVTVNTQPAAITGTPSVCVGSVTALTDATGGGTWTSVSGAIGTVDGVGNVTGISAGTTVVSYTIGTCAASVVVTVNTQPGAILGTLTVCETFTTSLSDAPTGGVWSSVSGGVASITPAGLVTGLSAGTSVFSYTIGSCAATAVVTVNTQPAAITGTPSVCVGFTTALTDATAGGTWSSVTVGVGTVDGVGNVTGISVGTTLISYTLGTCAATLNVTVNAEPAAITGNTGPICETFTLPLSDATGGGTWSSVSVGVATVSGTGVVSGVGVGTSVISYAIGSCAVTTIVTVNLQPAAITGNFGVCDGFTTQLSDVTGGGTWSSVTVAVGTVDGTGLVTGLGLGTTTISYTIGSCAATAVVTVNTQPVAITGTLSVCNGFTTQLTDLTAGGSWSVAPPPGIATISVTGLVSGTGVGTATISYSISGCAATAVVTVNTQPAAITGNFGVCNGFTTQLSEVTGGGTWTSVTTTVGTVDGTGLVTGVGLGTTIISYTIGSCAATAVVTVNTQPVAITGTLTVCNGFTTQLTDLTSGGAWSVAPPPGIATVNATGLVTGTGVGTATISYDISGCAATAVVTVNLQPGAINGVLSVCQGLTTQLTDGDAGGTWSSAPVTTGSISATGLVTGITVGTATISYTIGTCAATAIVTVEPLPVAISGTKTVCVGLTTSLTDATGGGTWSASNGNATVIVGTGVVTGAFAGTDVITYTIGTGCTVTTIVTINPLPANISGANQVCVGSTVTLSDATGGGTWSSANPLIAFISGTGVVTGVTAGVTTITYKLSTGCIITMSMTVNPLPSLITGPGVVCPGATITLTDAAGAGTWTSSNTAVATVGAATGIVTGVAGGTSNITFTLGTGCNIFKTITVNPAPAAVITPLGDTTFCPGGFVVLQANIGAGLTYQWTRGGVSIPGAVTSEYIANITGSYQVSEINSFGCSGVSIPMLVTSDTPAAVITSATGLTTICAGTSLELDASTGVGLTYQWLLGGVAIAGANSSTYTTSNAGDYSVVITNATGCSATSNVLTISINPSPTANITLSGPITFCLGGSVTISTDFAAGYAYQWYNAAGAIAGANSSSYTATTTDGYYVIVTNGYGCTATSVTTNVVANALPDVTITAATSTVFCAGGSVSLSVPTVAGDTYQWYQGGVAIPGATGPSYLATASGGYQVMVTDPTTGCSAETPTPTVVNAVAAAVIVPITSASYCWGSSAMLSTNVTGAAGTVTYVWMLNGVVIPGAVSGLYNATVPGDYTVQITIAGTCTMTSVALTVTEFPLPNPIVSYASGMFSTGTWFVTYQWFKNLTAIPGATTYRTPSTGYGNYKVQVTDTNGCQSFSDEYVFNSGGGGSTGVQGVNKTDVQIYPNPAQTMVHVEAAMQVRAVISSIDGRTIMDITDAKDIDLSRLADGVYMIAIYDTNGDKIKIDKLVKAAN